jgi:putative transcriptional regulator
MAKNKKRIAEAPTFADDVVASLRDFVRRREKGETLTIRTVKLDLEPAEYSPADIQQLRALLGMSQAVFAKLLAVSAKLVQHWEHGQRSPQPIARRLLDEVRADPERWKAKLNPEQHLATT